MRTPIKLLYGAAVATATTVMFLIGAGPASAGPATTTTQSAVNDVRTNGVRGPYRAAWICHGVGIAGLVAGSWSWYNCVQDTYGDFWLVTI